MAMVDECYADDEEDELVGFGFSPSEEELIRDYLLSKLGFDQDQRNKIFTLEDKENSYAEKPWQLNHTKNDIFEPNEWFYFVKRNRKVKGWKDTGGLKYVNVVSRKTGRVIGKKRNLSFYVKSKPSVWTMTTEYSSIDKSFRNQVLCHLKGP
ncbi:PREDICTED: NAC domain-containing protein 35 [Camelina sativa]|uniref:NAC domain-containing protein 35 n=1 Tax=Camelina sativa TaxID=90675 RepID=A0ABM0VCA4_CAMSA|nr:PREDICTED: NAC domain-containing protein 35 [Camelina sativa]